MRPPSKITVSLPHGEDVDLCNEERGAMVEPLLWAFARAYYHGDVAYMEEEGHLLDYVVSDFLADVMHWCGHDHVIVSSDTGPDTVLGRARFVDLVAVAQHHYTEEVDDERGLRDRRMFCDACHRVGTVEDMCYPDEPCPDEECGGTIHIIEEDA